MVLCDLCVLAQMLFVGNFAGAGIIFTNITVMAGFLKGYETGPRKVIFMLGLLDGVLV